MAAPDSFRGPFLFLIYYYGDIKMAISDIALCSRALIRLGANPITSFDDGTAESEIAAALYPSIRDALLSSYPWTFATAQIELNQLQESPLVDFSTAFELPNDFLRAISIGSSKKSQGARYKILQNNIHTNMKSVVLSYIFQQDEEEYPPFFDIALIARLAAEFSIPVTESTSRTQTLYDLAERELEKARQIDAQQDSPNRIENYPLIDVR